MEGLESYLWHATKRGKEGCPEISDEQVGKLRELSEKCGGWIYLDSVMEKTFISTRDLEELKFWFIVISYPEKDFEKLEIPNFKLIEQYSSDHHYRRSSENGSPTTHLTFEFKEELAAAKAMQKMRALGKPFTVEGPYLSYW